MAAAFTLHMGKYLRPCTVDAVIAGTDCAVIYRGGRTVPDIVPVADIVPANQVRVTRSSKLVKRELI